MAAAGGALRCAAVPVITRAAAARHRRLTRPSHRRCPQNSNLVMTSDVKRDAHEPTGEPETLAGRIKHKMGDRVLHSRPEGLAERKDRSK